MKFKKRQYKIGDRVRIVSEWGPSAGVNKEGLMDKWLGKVMTVRAYESGSLYRMEEDKTENDGAGWFWDDGDIVGLAGPDEVKPGDYIRTKNSAGYAPAVKAGDIMRVNSVHKDKAGRVNLVSVLVRDHVRPNDLCSEATMDDELNYFYPEECEKVENPTPEKIVITTDGRTTKARHYTGKELTGEAVAVCSPSDSFDFKTGARIAIDRLLGAESKVETAKTLRDVVAERDPKSINGTAKGGVLCCPMDYDYLHAQRPDYCVYCQETCTACWSRPYVEPQAEPKFKPGDVVVVKGCTDVKHYYPTNSLAIVQEIKTDKEPEILSPYAYLCLGCDHNGELRQVVGEVDLRAAK